MRDLWVKYSTWKEARARKDLKKHDYVCANVKILIGGGDIGVEKIKGARGIGRLSEKIVERSKIAAEHVCRFEKEGWTCTVGYVLEVEELGLRTTLSCLAERGGAYTIIGFMCNSVSYMLGEQRKMLAKYLNIDVNKIECYNVENEIV